MRIWIGMAAALAVAACGSSNGQEGGDGGPQGAAKVDGEYLTTGGDGSDWPAINFSYAEQRFSPLDDINTENVDELGIAWTADLPDARAQEATPVVVDGIMYLTGPWSKVFAFDASNGEPLWEFDPEVDRNVLQNLCCDAVNRGVAVWRGKLYVGTLDGRLIALDAISGAQLWSTQTTDQNEPYSITGAPRVVNNRVIIGNGGAEFGVRGYVSAYDANTGELDWRFYTVPNPDGEPDNAASDEVLQRAAARTWSEEGDWRESGGGGTVWDAIVYDPELDQLYIGVGNGNPWNHGLRSNGEGDNLFLSSIVALNPETGEYIWHYQETPGETWDYTATQHIIQATLTIDGEERQVLMHAPKNGFFFVIDRTDGELISAKPFVEGLNWAEGYGEDGRPIENPASRFYRTGEPFLAIPGPLGAHNWQPMAFNPNSGLVYIPANQVPSAYVPPGAEDVARGDIGYNTGINFRDIALPEDPEFMRAAIAAVTGQLVAYDPVAGEVRWTVDYPTPWNGGLLTTAGNLVFQGTMTGQFKAYNAETGDELWSMDTQSGVLAGASTFYVDGVQHIAFTTGRGGAFTITAGRADITAREVPNVPRLIVLRIGGTGVLPDAPDADAIALEPPESTGTDQQIELGRQLYTRYCMVCHGDAAVGGGVNPDLRFSGYLTSEDAWNQAVLEGALTENGMPNFSAVLNTARADAIRHYVIHKANWDLDQMRARREEEGEDEG